MPVQRPFHVIAMPVFHCMLKRGPYISCCSSFSQLFHWSSLVFCDVRMKVVNSNLLSHTSHFCCKKFGVRILWVSAPCRLALAFQRLPLVFAISSEMVLRFSLIAICTLWCSLMFFLWSHWFPNDVCRCSLVFRYFSLAAFYFRLCGHNFCFLKNCNWFSKMFA